MLLALLRFMFLNIPSHFSMVSNDNPALCFFSPTSHFKVVQPLLLLLQVAPFNVCFEKYYLVSSTLLFILNCFFKLI